MVFQFLWSSLAQGVAYAVNGFSFEGIEEGDAVFELFQVLTILDPTAAYQQGTLWVVRRLADSGESTPDLAFYLQDWFGFIVMALWIVVPLAVGYTRAARIVDQLEEAGIVGPFNGTKARDVLVGDEEELDQLLHGDEDGDEPSPDDAE